jgi:hypothetical protein
MGPSQEPSQFQSPSSDGAEQLTSGASILSALWSGAEVQLLVRRRKLVTSLRSAHLLEFRLHLLDESFINRLMVLFNHRLQLLPHAGALLR